MGHGIDEISDCALSFSRMDASFLFHALDFRYGKMQNQRLGALVWHRIPAPRESVSDGLKHHESLLRSIQLLVASNTPE